MVTSKGLGQEATKAKWKKDAKKKKKSDFEASRWRCQAAGEEELEEPDFSSDDESLVPPGGTADSTHFPSNASVLKHGLGIVIDNRRRRLQACTGRWPIGGHYLWRRCSS